MIESPFKKHLVLFERTAMEKLLHVHTVDGVFPFTEFFEKAKPLEENKVQTYQVDFGDEHTLGTDTSESFSLVSESALNGENWAESFFMPTVSISVMDRSCKIYPLNLMTHLKGDQINWFETHKALKFQSLITGAISAMLPKLLDPQTQKQLYLPDRPIAINLSSMNVMVRKAGVFPMLLIQVIVMVDEVLPAIHADALTKELESAELSEDLIQRLTYAPITTEEYRLAWQNPDISTTTSALQILIKLAYSQLMEFWAERIITQLDDPANQSPL